MSQVNLLPPEIRQRQAVRRTTTTVVAAGLGVLVLIGIFYLLQIQRLSSAQDELAAQQARNAALERQIQDLQRFAALQEELAAKEQLLAAVYENEVSWSGALLDVSRVIPDPSYLTNLTGQITATGATTTGEVPATTGGTPETTLIGNMTFEGVADQTQTIADWLIRLEQIKGWVNAWVNTTQENVPSSGIYTFTNGLDLTQQAATARGQEAEAP